MTSRCLWTAIAAGLVAGMVSGWSPMAAAASSTPTIPLPSGVSTPSESSVSLPMGHLSDPDNTFWEIFLRSAGNTSWTLRTPVGVADNGGLVVADPVNGPVTVGFLPSQLLRFSPLAQTSDEGKTWSPGDLPSALVAAPDALAGGPSDLTAALVTGSGQTVLSSREDLSGWRQLVTTRSLAKTVKGCGVQRITALASDGNYPILGVQCSRTGRIGVLVPQAGATAAPTGPGPTWTNKGPLLPDAASGVATVLRLEATASASDSAAGSLTGLARMEVGRSSSLVAFWSGGASSSWTQSTRLTIPSGWAVGATATGGGSTGRGISVLLDSGVHRRIVSVAGPGARWVTLVPPAGTGAIAAVGTEVDAFVVNKSHLTVWASGSRTAGWSRVQSTTVPVPYGSSG
jgi:hypothetical protein